MKKPREYCKWCNLTFGLAERQVEFNGQLMHQHCFRKAMNEHGKLQAQAKLAEFKLIMAKVATIQ